MTETFSVLCKKCKCCLANTTHCWTCHTTKSMEQLCGDDQCEEKLNDYLAREEARRIKVESARLARARSA